MEILPVAKIYTDFNEKFGIPRQSGLTSVTGKIVFEPEYRNPDFIRGLDSFSHIWLIWEFSDNIRAVHSPTVRPPRLGGNTRIGVFATRSPFRPNNLGLSCLEIHHIEYSPSEGPLIFVKGPDLKNGTPIYDIKPYIPYADCRPEASEGFAPAPDENLSVVFDNGSDSVLDEETADVLCQILSLDPRPHYHNDDRTYGLSFSDYEVHFTVTGNTVHVKDILKRKEG